MSRKKRFCKFTNFLYAGRIDFRMQSHVKAKPKGKRGCWTGPDRIEPVQVHAGTKNSAKALNRRGCECEKRKCNRRGEWRIPDRKGWRSVVYTRSTPEWESRLRFLLTRQEEKKHSTHRKVVIQIPRWQ